MFADALAAAGGPADGEVAVVAGDDCELLLGPVARMRHEEFLLRRDLEGALDAGDAARINRATYFLGLALHRRAEGRCSQRVGVQRVAAALLGRSGDGDDFFVDRNSVALARYRMWAQLGPSGPLSLLDASEVTWDHLHETEIPTLTLIERVRVQQLVGEREGGKRARRRPT